MRTLKSLTVLKYLGMLLMTKTAHSQELGIRLGDALAIITAELKKAVIQSLKIYKNRIWLC